MARKRRARVYRLRGDLEIEREEDKGSGYRAYMNRLEQVEQILQGARFEGGRVAFVDYSFPITSDQEMIKRSVVLTVEGAPPSRFGASYQITEHAHFIPTHPAEVGGSGTGELTPEEAAGE